VFTVAWSILGALSPGYTVHGTVIAPYFPVSQPISGLGLGPTGPAMNTAFVVCGVMLLAGVTAVFPGIDQLSGVSRRLCIGLLYKLWRTRDPKGYHVEYGYSCMGYEIAGRLGAKMACPDRDVYVMVGDGSYLMTRRRW
jgi:hypothetical protein